MSYSASKTVQHFSTTRQIKEVYIRREIHYGTRLDKDVKETWEKTRGRRSKEDNVVKGSQKDLKLFDDLHSRKLELGKKINKSQNFQAQKSEPFCTGPMSVRVSRGRAQHRPSPPRGRFTLTCRQAFWEKPRAPSDGSSRWKTEVFSPGGAKKSPATVLSLHMTLLDISH